MSCQLHAPAVLLRWRQQWDLVGLKVMTSETSWEMYAQRNNFGMSPEFNFWHLWMAPEFTRVSALWGGGGGVTGACVAGWWRHHEGFHSVAVRSVGIPQPVIYAHRNWSGFHVKCPLLCLISTKTRMCRKNFSIFFSIRFNRNSFSCSEVETCLQTDGGILIGAAQGCRRTSKSVPWQETDTRVSFPVPVKSRLYSSHSCAKIQLRTVGVQERAVISRHFTSEI
jgi:hypothetical protein